MRACCALCVFGRSKDAEAANRAGDQHDLADPARIQPRSINQSTSNPPTRRSAADATSHGTLV